MTTTSPNVTWTKLLGGSNNDCANSLTTGADGAIYVAGHTYSSDFDGQTNSGNYDAFITRYNPDGSKAWTQLLGGGVKTSREVSPPALTVPSMWRGIAGAMTLMVKRVRELLTPSLPATTPMAAKRGLSS